MSSLPERMVGPTGVEKGEIGCVLLGPQAKLVLGLPWHCPQKPEIVRNEEGNEVTEYTFQFDPPVNDIGGNLIESEILKLGRHHVSFEMMCHRLEAKFCDAELGIICRCCAGEVQGSPCGSCRHAIGFHICRNEHNRCGTHLWRKGTLHAGVLDVQAALFSLGGDSGTIAHRSR